MSAEHKAALAKGRQEGATVRRYLEALEATRPKRGRKRTHASMEKRLAGIEEQIDSTDNVLTRLQLVQEKQDLTEELSHNGNGVDVSRLEKDFIKVAKSYGERKGITYSTWRSMNVSPSVLAAAGIPRTHR